MALSSIKRCSHLDVSVVLAPERYDPRRAIAAALDSVPLSEIVIHVRKVIQPSDTLGACLVLDTSDAREGIIISRKHQTTDIGSTKKSTQPGDVIISRLRPYLRQVAFVDDAIPNLDDAMLLCSTEFFVMRPKDNNSIAFIVPFLLSRQVQKVLAASQEGGHHPRFDESMLMSLPVPFSLIQTRTNDSAEVEKAAARYRRSERSIDQLVAAADTAVTRSTSSDLSRQPI